MFGLGGAVAVVAAAAGAVDVGRTVLGPFVFADGGAFAADAAPAIPGMFGPLGLPIDAVAPLRVDKSAGCDEQLKLEAVTLITSNSRRTENIVGLRIAAEIDRSAA